MTTTLPLVLAACAWQAPLAPDAREPDGALAGVVLAEEPTDVFLMVFAEDDPPPPAGLGAPVDFVAVGEGDFEDGVEGLLAADFEVLGVASGAWSITALGDEDGDFQPLLLATAGATCGDQVGGHFADGELATLDVESGELVDGIAVELAWSLATERPAFVVEEGQLVAASGELQTFELVSTAINSPVVVLDGPWDGTGECQVAFHLSGVDDDGDGFVDPDPDEERAQAGAWAVWPHVVMSYTGEGDVALEAGESYVAAPWVDLTAIDDPGVTVTRGGVHIAGPVVLTRLPLSFASAALHALPDGTTEVVTGAEVPAGTWSITVIEATGQTWTVPNELPGFGSLGGTYDPVLQAVGVTLL